MVNGLQVYLRDNPNIDVEMAGLLLPHERARLRGFDQDAMWVVVSAHHSLVDRAALYTCGSTGTNLVKKGQVTMLLTELVLQVPE